MNTRVCILLVSLTASAAIAALPAPVQRGAPQSKALVDWVKQRAVALRTIAPEGPDADLQVIGTLIHPQTRLIGLGEGGRHYVPEFMTIRNRLFAYLVEHHGVTAYAGETSFTDAIRVDDYITGEGELTSEIVDAAYTGVSGRTDDSVESRQLIEWMRAYNLRPTTRRPLRFYGIDSCTTRSPCIRAALDAALDYIRGVDPGEAQALGQRLMPYREPKKVRLTQRDALTASIADLVRLFTAKHVKWVRQTSALAYHRAYRNAIIARQLDDGFRVGMQYDRSSDPEVIDRRASSGGWWDEDSPRDASMKENVLWALEREGSEGRIFLFGGYSHLDKGSSIAGGQLDEVLGRQYVVIGLFGACADGFEDSKMTARYPSLTTLLGSAGRPLFFLDTTNMALLATLPSENEWGAEGKASSTDHRAPTWRLQDSLDGLIFINSVHPIRRWE